MTTNLAQLTYLHIVTAEFHTGMLVLATACVVMRVFADAYTLWLRPKLPSNLRFLDGLVEWLTPYLDRTAIIAMLGGIGAFTVSVATGFYVWEFGRPYDDGVLQNKVLFSTMAATLWCSAIAIRLRYTEALWNVPRMSNLYVLVVAGAMGNTAFAGALGAKTTVGHCFFDPLFKYAGWDPKNTLSIAPTISMLMVLAGVVCGVLYLLLLAPGRRTATA